MTTRGDGPTVIVSSFKLTFVCSTVFSMAELHHQLGFEREPIRTAGREVGRVHRDGGAAARGIDLAREGTVLRAGPGRAGLGIESHVSLFGFPGQGQVGIPFVDHTQVPDIQHTCHTSRKTVPA
jgi:hypothetical protein